MTTNTDPVRALRELRDTGDVSDWRAMGAALGAAIEALGPALEPDGYTSYGEFRWACDCDDRMKREWTPVYLAPPSAPVGVEWLRAELNASAAYAGDYIGDERVVLLAVVMRKLDKLAALAQQPAASSEPEPELDAYDPESGEKVAQWLYRAGLQNLAFVVRTQLDIRAPQQPAGVGRVCSEDILWCEDIAESLQEAGGPTNSMRLVALRRLLALAAQQQGGADHG